MPERIGFRLPNNPAIIGYRTDNIRLRNPAIRSQQRSPVFFQDHAFPPIRRGGLGLVLHRYRPLFFFFQGKVLFNLRHDPFVIHPLLGEGDHFMQVALHTMNFIQPASCRIREVVIRVNQVNLQRPERGHLGGPLQRFRRHRPAMHFQDQERSPQGRLHGIAHQGGQVGLPGIHQRTTVQDALEQPHGLFRPNHTGRPALALHTKPVLMIDERLFNKRRNLFRRHRHHRQKLPALPRLFMSPVLLP